jgi:hypothetical protein
VGNYPSTELIVFPPLHQASTLYPHPQVSAYQSSLGYCHQPLYPRLMDLVPFPLFCPSPSTPFLYSCHLDVHSDPSKLMTVTASLIIPSNSSKICTVIAYNDLSRGVPKGVNYHSVRVGLIFTTCRMSIGGRISTIRCRTATLQQIPSFKFLQIGTILFKEVFRVFKTLIKPFQPQSPIQKLCVWVLFSPPGADISKMPMALCGYMGEANFLIVLITVIVLIAIIATYSIKSKL